MPEFDIEVIYEAEPRTVTVSGDSMQEVWKRREQIAAELPRGLAKARVLSIAPSEGRAARPVSPPQILPPPKQRQHVGCPQCGTVITVPLDPNEQPPWCLHHDSNYCWRDPVIGPDNKNPWVRMVQVEVRMPGPAS